MVDGWTNLGRILQYTPLQRSIPTVLRGRSWDIPGQQVRSEFRNLSNYMQLQVSGYGMNMSGTQSDSSKAMIWFVYIQKNAWNWYGRSNLKHQCGILSGKYHSLQPAHDVGYYAIAMLSSNPVRSPRSKMARDRSQCDCTNPQATLFSMMSLVPFVYLYIYIYVCMYVCMYLAHKSAEKSHRHPPQTKTKWFMNHLNLQQCQGQIRPSFFWYIYIIHIYIYMIYGYIVISHRIHGAAIYGNMDPIHIPQSC